MTNRAKGVVGSLAAGAAFWAVVAFIIAAALGGCSHHTQGHPDALNVRFDGQHLAWDWRGQPHKPFHFDVTYDSGHERYAMVGYLDAPGYVAPGAPDTLGCGWQHWVMYAAHSITQLPVEHPRGVIARGDVYMCYQPQSRWVN